MAVPACAHDPALISCACPCNASSRDRTRPRPPDCPRPRRALTADDGARRRRACLRAWPCRAQHAARRAAARPKRSETAVGSEYAPAQVELRLGDDHGATGVECAMVRMVWPRDRTLPSIVVSSSTCRASAFGRGDPDPADLALPTFLGEAGRGRTVTDRTPSAPSTTDADQAQGEGRPSPYTDPISGFYAGG